jgi:uncharacterized membrane protein YdbT with pleckstrin-like domain
MIENKKFVSILEDENILLISHRSWFYIAQQFVVVVIMLLVFFAGIIILPIIFPTMLGGQSQKVMLFVETLFLMAIWIFGFLIWIDYYYDLWIITDKRLMNIEQRGLFMRKTSELDYAKVQDVSVDIKGFLATVLNYGDVLVQTAGEQPNFLFRTIPNPLYVKKLIMQQVQLDEREGINELGTLLQTKIETKHN